MEAVRLRNKSAIYRLTGASPGAETVIAKRADADALGHEWALYDRVLPQLPLSRPRAYGFVEDGPRAWLFLEDAGDTVCDPVAAAAVAMSWLATLHGAAAQLDLAGLVPGRSADHFRQQMDAARETIAERFDSPGLRSSDRSSLASIVQISAHIDARWHVVEEVWATGPLTLLHGDFVKRNLRLRRGQDGADSLHALDWECSGAGSPAPDLEVMALHPELIAPYRAAIRRFIPRLSEEQVAALARLGVGLRLLMSIAWATVWLECPWPQTGLAQLQIYEPLLARWARSLTRSQAGRGAR